MDKEKMLIEVKQDNIFTKAINFLKKIFFRKKEQKVINQFTYKKDNSFMSKIEGDRKILNIQERFENGELNEDELTQEEKTELFYLYNEQINMLEQDIKQYNKVLKLYKEKILIAKSKLENNQ